MVAASRCFKHIFRCKSKISVSAATPRSLDFNSVSIRRFGSRFAIREIGHYRYHNCITYIPVSFPWIGPFFVTISKIMGNYQLLATKAPSDEEELADEVLNQVIATTESAPESNREIYTVYVDKLCRAGNLSGAARLLQSLRYKNILLSQNAYNLLLVASGERNDIDLLSQVFKDLLVSCGSLSARSYLNLARAFAKMNDCTQLLGFVKEVSELAYPRSTTVVNRIIFAFAECRQIEKALLIFDQIKILKCKPDLITYNTVLDILGLAGRVDEMLHKFASMKEDGITPDFISYNTLLNSLRKAGRLDTCLVIFREMGESRIEPDLLTYTALIESFGRSGNIEESLRLFSEMKQRKIRPSIHIYRSLMNNLKKMGKVELAMTFWEEMNSSLSDLARPKDFKRKVR